MNIPVIADIMALSSAMRDFEVLYDDDGTGNIKVEFEDSSFSSGTIFYYFDGHHSTTYIRFNSIAEAVAQLVMARRGGQRKV